MKGRVYYAINSEGCGLFELDLDPKYSPYAHIERLMQAFDRTIGSYAVVKIELDYAGG
jgi:hypothetical protein